MGGYALPALDIRSQPQPDLLQKFSQLQQLQGQRQAQQQQAALAPLQQQAAQQNVDSGALEIQQKQQALKNQQAITAAYQKWDGKNYDDLSHLALQNGATGDAVQAIQQHGLALRKTASEIAKDDATTGKDNAETTIKKNGAVLGALTSLSQVPDDQLAQALTTTAANLAQQNILDPQHLQQAQQLAQLGDPTKIRQQLAIMEKGLTSFSDLLDQEKQTATEENNKALRAQAAATLANTSAHQTVTEQQGRQRINIESARLAFDKQRQGTQDGQAIEAQAQQIANGDVKPLSQGRANPFNRAVMARVYELNPKYTDSLYTATQDLRSSKPNSAGGNVQRLGTAILHADNALDNSSKLGFSEGLLIGVPTEGTAAYKQDAEFLTGEVGQYVTGGKLTVDEGKKLSGDLMSSRQGVRDSAIKQIIDLSGGKLKSQMEQFKNATQNEFPTDRVFNDPSIKGALQKHGVLGGGQGPAGLKDTGQTTKMADGVYDKGGKHYTVMSGKVYE